MLFDVLTVILGSFEGFGGVSSRGTSDGGSHTSLALYGRMHYIFGQGTWGLDSGLLIGSNVVENDGWNDAGAFGYILL